MSPNAGEGPHVRVRIPADVERPDRLLANLSARQLAILGVAGVALWSIYMATRHVVPLAAFGVVACPLGGAAAMLAVGRIEGQPADRYVASAWRQLHAPRRLVPAPEGVPPTPTWVAPASGDLPAPLHLPLGGIDAEGVVDLGPDGLAVLCRASSVTFSLRTPLEQEALVAGFARWLNSLAEPIQLVLRAEPVDLAPMIDGLRAGAPSLPHPGLEEAARAHAGFLADLAAGRTLLRREVLVVLRQLHGEGAQDRLHRRADEAAGALASAGVTLSVLDGPAARACLLRALDHGAARPTGTSASDDEVITARGV